MCYPTKNYLFSKYLLFSMKSVLWRRMDLVLTYNMKRITVSMMSDEDIQNEYYKITGGF